MGQSIQVALVDIGIKCFLLYGKPEKFSGALVLMDDSDGGRGVESI